MCLCVCLYVCYSIIMVYIMLVCVCAYKHVQTKSLHDFARFSKQFITETLGQEHSDTWLVKHGSI